MGKDNKNKDNIDNISCPYKKFNKYFKTFIRELAKTYPHVSEYKWVIAGYKIFKTINKKIPSKVWHEVMTAEIKDAVFKKNAEYFLNPEFTVKGYDNVTQMMRREWPLMDAHSHEMIWQHMMCIIALAQNCA